MWESCDNCPQTSVLSLDKNLFRDFLSENVLVEPIRKKRTLMLLFLSDGYKIFSKNLLLKQKIRSPSNIYLLHNIGIHISMCSPPPFCMQRSPNTGSVAQLGNWAWTKFRSLKVCRSIPALCLGWHLWFYLSQNPVLKIYWYIHTVLPPTSGLISVLKEILK